METKTTEEYYADISGWDWQGIKKDAQANALEQEESTGDGEWVGSTFLGTVFALCPSGKYYMPWACSNVTEEEAEEDEKWQEALEKVADEHDMWIENGDGDPCDLFACIRVESIHDDDEEG